MFNIFKVFTTTSLIISSLSAGDISDDVLTAVHKLGYNKVTLQNIIPTRASGNNTDSIHIIELSKNNGLQNSLISKELKGRKRERVNLENLKPFIAEYTAFERSQPLSSPHKNLTFASYIHTVKIGNKEFAFFNKASGQSVFDLMLEWSIKGYHSLNSMGPIECKSRLKDHFLNIGAAIAKFHLKYAHFDDASGEFKTAIHGDLHTSNIFYGIVSNQTTLIDYETLSNTPLHDLRYELDRLFNFSYSETKPLVIEKAQEKFARENPVFFLDEQQDNDRKKYVQRSLDILDDFFGAMKSSYTYAFKNAGYKCDIRNAKIEKL